MNSLSFRCKYITRLLQNDASFKHSSTQRINLQMCWILLTSDYATHFGHHYIKIGTLCVLIWFALLSLWIKRCFALVFQIAKTLGSTSVRYLSEAKVSDSCLIDVDHWLWSLGYLVSNQTHCLKSSENRLFFQKLSWRHHASHYLLIWALCQIHPQLHHTAAWVHVPLEL